jgi:hypothetical protein
MGRARSRAAARTMRFIDVRRIRLSFVFYLTGVLTRTREQVLKFLGMDCFVGSVKQLPCGTAITDAATEAMGLARIGGLFFKGRRRYPLGRMLMIQRNLISLTVW